MTAPSFPAPAAHPYVLADSFDETWPDMALRSTVDAGPAKQRRIGTSAPDSIQVAYIFTTEELATLRAFYEGDAGAGSVWFSWTHPRTLDTVQARFLVGQPPRVKAYKPDWLVTMTLEVRP